MNVPINETIKENTCLAQKGRLNYAEVGLTMREIENLPVYLNENIYWNMKHLLKYILPLLGRIVLLLILMGCKT